MSSVGGCDSGSLTVLISFAQPNTAAFSCFRASGVVSPCAGNSSSKWGVEEIIEMIDAQIVCRISQR